MNNISIKREKEYFIKRREKREKMEEFLPAEKQLELGDKEKPKEKRSSPVFWRFDETLLSKRSSESPKDKLFFETIRQKIREKLNKEYKQDRAKLENLNKQAQKERESIKDTLQYNLITQKGLEKCGSEGWWDWYAQIFS